MNNALRKIAFFVGVGVLLVSMYWSQDGWNFDIAGDSGYKATAIAIGWFLAIAVTTMQFVFSSNFRELNASLILFGALAYAYSMYTNYQGILHFQGIEPNKIAAAALAVIMDAAAEPMIAWALYVSRDGDFVGNIIKAIMSAPDKFQQENRASQPNHPKSGQKPVGNPGFRSFSSDFGGNRAKSKPSFRFDGLNLPGLEEKGKNDDTKPNIRH